MHFREPVGLNEKTLLQKANLDKSIDFLDTVEEDIPKGILLIFFNGQNQVFSLAYRIIRKSLIVSMEAQNYP